MPASSTCCGVLFGSLRCDRAPGHVGPHRGSREQPFPADPVEALVATEAQADHAKARARGERVRALADACLNALFGPGILPAARLDDARVVLFNVLADDLYGNTSLDIPPLRKDADHGPR